MLLIGSSLHGAAPNMMFCLERGVLRHDYGEVMAIRVDSSSNFEITNMTFWSLAKMVPQGQRRKNVRELQTNWNIIIIMSKASMSKVSIIIIMSKVSIIISKVSICHVKSIYIM